jgi:hypothetical protein
MAKEKFERLNVEVEKKKYKTFKEALKEEGFTVKGLITRWIDEYLKVKK